MIKNCLFILVFAFSIFINGISQNESLPDNLQLSFNGKFIKGDLKDGFDKTSENGVYQAKYEIGNVSHNNREILNFQLFKNNELVYTLEQLPGSDMNISNSGELAVFDLSESFRQKLSISIYSPEGEFKFQSTFKYASLFGFSPSGKYFLVGTDKNLNIFSLENQSVNKVKRSSQFAFSADEDYLVTAFEDELIVYKNFTKVNSWNTGLIYPRDVAILGKEKTVAVIGKSELLIYNMESEILMNTSELEENYSYRDLEVFNNRIFTGIMFKNDGELKGILNIVETNGNIKSQQVLAEKTYPTFKDAKPLPKGTKEYAPIPWPFFPFDSIHKVWNHYEQHMGNGTEDYGYLHQGLDIEVPDNEPTYAVEEGWVKLVLTLGGDVYWRAAVAPEQVSGYSDGWLYAHLVESSIVVEVGDYVELHDYLGDIIHWSADWGHIHFVNIHDHGDVWYYDDDEWGINFNPLLAITPLGDDVAPLIESYSSNSKFGFCENETSNYLDAENLTGDVDIIAKISDYHANSEWEQPAYRTYYWITNPSTNDTLVQKILSNILDHPYEMYSGNYYEPYAEIFYKKDYLHPSPPWMDWNRDYWQILTNNNGDSIADPSEGQLALNTAEYLDGNYRLFVEAWDEAGNMAIDSQNIVFTNYVGLDENSLNISRNLNCYPNPAKESFTVDFNLDSNVGELLVSDIKGKLIFSKEISQSSKQIKLSSSQWDAGVYFISLKVSGQPLESRKMLIID